MNKLLKNFSAKAFVCGLLIATLSLIFAGCSKKVASADLFKSTAEANGFEVSEDSALAQANSLRTVVAKREDTMLCFWEFDNAENAQAIYDQLFEQSQGAKEAAPGAVLEGSNFKKYTIEDIEDFSILSRVENTLIMGVCTIGAKENLKAVTNALGY